MGVIDLDARVKALEENSGNSAEIDQIESDLTALENTVSGITEDVTDKLTLNEALTFESTPSYVAYRVGDIVVLSFTGNITAGASAAGSVTKIMTADSTICPAFEALGTVRTSTGMNTAGIDSSGNVNTRAGGTWQQITLTWVIKQS